MLKVKLYAKSQLVLSSGVTIYDAHNSHPVSVCHYQKSMAAMITLSVFPANLRQNPPFHY